MGNLTQLFGQNKRCALRQLYTFVGFVKFTPYAISAVIVQRDCAISVALLHSVRTSGNGRCGLLRLRRSNGLCGNFRFSGLRRSFGFGGSSRFGGRGRLSGSSGLHGRTERAVHRMGLCRRQGKTRDALYAIQRLGSGHKPGEVKFAAMSLKRFALWKWNALFRSVPLPLFLREICRKPGRRPMRSRAS